ncbi:similar to Saccharomyces cerevisiae YEL042W GDA1 Guanosine diphosphatase located in the Golgi [Maudiozyma saulgeensis]|uniref:Guanosine-diphosphatase n=1 Tax=Maudiozyma saulgeensis TaxID=1789683 RepID=A0A1X7QXL5_9SACH|nr:similar to Saccharomyces cerevisiae YEL042W GDA1 Guanosine diphosphatase located in the Golgi [Kazachstania saulgeensis]
MAPLVRNYRFLIGAFAVMMLFFLIKTSTTAGPSMDIARNVAGTVNRPETPPDVSTLPVSNNPGYISDPKTDNTNSEVADAVKSQTEQAANTASKGSTKCGKDHQYVVMIDAGSSGSRVHVYEFDVCSQPPALIDETFEMLKPGLSSFENDPVGAAKSLDPLLEIALKAVPESKRSCTPVAVKATAGLRKLGEAASIKILDQVRVHLETNYPFAVVDGDGVSIMDGAEEGVYAWITVNYLLGNIGNSEKLDTSAVFDLGGGSTQIVFEPTFASNEKMVDGEYKYDLSFGGHDYTLYQFSHLGYGLNEGRNKINSLLVLDAIKKGKIIQGDKSTIFELTSPCLPPNITNEKVKVVLDDKSAYFVTFSGPKVAAGAQCRYLADQALHKDAACTQPPCSFNGVHQPSLVRTFKETNDLYMFSFFYDKTHSLGMPLSFTLNEMMDLTRMVCNGEEVWESVFSNIGDSLQTLKDNPNFCQDLSFEVSLLHTGYDIPLHRELKTGEDIDGNQLGWCLGASLPLLESDNWKCGVSKVQ